MAAARAVQVVTEVAPLERPFDYLVTEATSRVAVGDRVRVDLHGRSVRGWVVGESSNDESRELKPLAKWLGLGPPPALIELLRWCAWRWDGPLARFLLAASPVRVVSALPTAAAKTPLSDESRSSVLDQPSGVVRLAPTIDPLGLVLAAYAASDGRDGSVLVLAPTEAWATRLLGRLAQRGLAVASASEWEKARAGWPVIVGARGAAFAPTPRIAAAVVIDADDEAYRSEASPTWWAPEVVAERCRRDGAPMWVSSPLPSPTLIEQFGHVSVADDEFARWGNVQVVDRRRGDPHDGALAAESVTAAHQALDGDEPIAVVVLLQRLGAGRLFACRECGELARCEQCGLAEQERDGHLECPAHGGARLLFCRSCGSLALRKVRSGVTTLARDVGAQLGQNVAEITASSSVSTPSARVVVGTEAVWQRVRRAGVVIFADFDQYLLAPRERARRDAILAVARASRLVGSRRDGRGRVILQTRRGDDAVLSAITTGQFDAISDDECRDARDLHLPPYAARAEVSGDGAHEFIARLADSALSISISGDHYVVRADRIETLADRLAVTERPAGRLRVAVI